MIHLIAVLVFSATPISVTRVIDGDTVVAIVNGMETRVRLYGIDAPEMGQVYGPAARLRLMMLLGLHADKMTVETTGIDRYGRVIGILYDGDRDLNKMLIEDGFAWHYKKYSKDRDDYAEAQKVAKKKRRWLWKQKNPVAPWAWRKSR